MLRRHVLGGRPKGSSARSTSAKPEGVSSDGTHVWVTNATRDTVSEIEASSGTVIRTIHVGEDPEGVSSDGTHVGSRTWRRNGQ